MTAAPELVPTLVTYPAGSLQECARVVETLRDHRPHSEHRTLLVTDRTPFHPLDPLWPDQPDDHGSVHLAGHPRRRVHRTLTIAQRPGGRAHGTRGWASGPGHRLGLVIRVRLGGM